MDIHLNRKDLYQLSCVTGRSLGLLPASDKKKCHKVIIGADNGVVTCFRIKKGEALEEYATPNLDYPVSRLFIGGPPEKRDRIFFTSAQTIRGVNKKGKEFFRFNTDGTETLKGIHIEDTRIWTTGEYMFNYYVDTKDAGYYMSPDRINDLLLTPILNQVDLNPVLGCQDRHVRVLDVNKLHFEAFVDGAVQSMCLFNSKGLGDILTRAGEREVLYGTDSGLIGQLLCDSKSLRPGWVVPNIRGLGSITNLLAHDVTDSGQQDIIVTRDDGELQILSIDSNGEPVETFSRCMNECIQGVDIGKVSTTNFEEIVIATYSGKVLSFTTEATERRDAPGSLAPVRGGMVEVSIKDKEGSSATPVHEADDGDDEESKVAKDKEEAKEKKKGGISSLFRIGSSKSKEKEKEKEKGSGASNVFSGGNDGDEAAKTDPLEREKKIKALQLEVAALREKVSASKESFGKMSKESVPVSTRSKVKHSLVLDETTACYKLSVESEMPIDIVALQSSLNILVLDPGASVPSLSAPDPSNDNQLLATLRIMGTSNRISITLMAFEGHHGTLSAYVITRVAPKVGHLVVNTIKPLSLHKIVPVQADKLEEAPMSEIKMSGSFTLGQIHSWVGSCFPDVPPKLPEGDSLRYMFKSTFLGTHVLAEYSRGEASFKSSNLSALALIKDVIAKEASLSKVKVDVRSPVINEGSVLHMLRILHPKLKELLKLKDSAKFLNALKEVSGQEENSADFLTPEMRQLVERSEEIKAEHKDNEKRIAFIEHVLEQLFIDRFKFKGVNVKHRVTEVKALVDKYSWEALTALFSIQ